MAGTTCRKVQMVTRFKSVASVQAKALRMAAMLIAVAGLLSGPLVSAECCQASLLGESRLETLPLDSVCCEQNSLAQQPMSFCSTCCQSCCQSQEASGAEAAPVSAPCRCQLQPRKPVASLLSSAVSVPDTDAASLTQLVPRPEGQIKARLVHFSETAGTLKRPVRILYGIWRN